VQAEGIFIAMVVGGAFFVFNYFRKRSRKMRETLDRMMLKFPIIGPILTSPPLRATRGRSPLCLRPAYRW